jgi:hypothetical protein
MLSQQRVLGLELPYPETNAVLGRVVTKQLLGAAAVGKQEEEVVGK